jgi:hypothetical protein
LPLSVFTAPLTSVGRYINSLDGGYTEPSKGE